MKIFLNVMAIIFLIVLVSFAILYWTTGIFYPISGVTLILFIVSVAGSQKLKKI